MKDLIGVSLSEPHDSSYIAWVPLLAHGLTVKPHAIVAKVFWLDEYVAACLCGHPKCNLLLVQARPRMIHHLTSIL